MANPGRRIPVTVVGGFLGAGKTTLVNHLVREGNRRFGVIVNEFGDVGVDGALIENVDEDGVAELANGCLCCVGREDLALAMTKLALRERPPEHLLVELSGLADPVPVAGTVLDPNLRGLFELDGLVGVADAPNLERTLTETPEGAVQLAYASLVVLNKTDLADTAGLETARRLVAEINPLAHIVEAKDARVEPRRLLEQGAFSPLWEPAGHRHAHARGVATFTLHADAPLEPAALDAFLEAYVIGRPGNVLRAKGFLAMRGAREEVLLQAVREIVTASGTGRPSPRRSSLVVIGRGLDEAEYRAAFARLPGRAERR